LALPTTSQPRKLRDAGLRAPDGWLTPVVNPDSYGSQGSDSPESEAFVLQMDAAWRDWVTDGSKGANGAYATPVGTVWVALAAVGTLLLLG